jgi:hypothetical protein
MRLSIDFRPKTLAELQLGIEATQYFSNQITSQSPSMQILIQTSDESLPI